jgi:hypothetical protein
MCKWKCFNSIPATTSLKVPCSIILNSWSSIYLILYYISFSTRRTPVTNQSSRREPWLVVQLYSLTPSTNTLRDPFPAHHHSHDCKKKINPEIELWGFEYSSGQLSLSFFGVGATSQLVTCEFQSLEECDEFGRHCRSIVRYVIRHPLPLCLLILSTYPAHSNSMGFLQAT